MYATPSVGGRNSGGSEGLHSFEGWAGDHPSRRRALRQVGMRIGSISYSIPVSDGVKVWGEDGWLES